jgi:hypothetical protein
VVIIFDRSDPRPVVGVGLPVSREDLDDAYGNIFRPNREHDAPDVTVLLVPSGVGNVMTLANARWYGCLAHSMSDEDKLQMLSACRGLLKDDGFEFRRCYSNGVPIRSTQTLEAFKTKAAFPRSLEAVHLVKLPMTWAGVYISPKPGRNGERIAVIYDQYTQPRPGGKFDMKPSVFDEYPVFSEFTRRKVQTAFLCQELEKRLGIHISPNAVKTTISHVCRARKIMKKDEVESDSEHVLLRIISALNKYTLVQHPCSKHRDVFRKVNLEELFGDSDVLWHMTDVQSDKLELRLKEISEEAIEDDACVSTSSLENKFVIAIKHSSRRGKGCGIGHGIGRGGAGKGK